MVGRGGRIKVYFLLCCLLHCGEVNTRVSRMCHKICGLRRGVGGSGEGWVAPETWASSQPQLLIPPPPLSKKDFNRKIRKEAKVEVLIFYASFLTGVEKSPPSATFKNSPYRCHLLSDTHNSFYDLYWKDSLKGRALSLWDMNILELFLFLRFLMCLHLCYLLWWVPHLRHLVTLHILPTSTNPQLT